MTRYVVTFAVDATVTVYVEAQDEAEAMEKGAETRLRAPPLWFKSQPHKECTNA